MQVSKLKHEIGDFVINEKSQSTTKVGMIIAIKPSNHYTYNVSKNCYSSVYYVLSSEGSIEGPLFSSEVRMILLFNFQLIDVNV